MEFGFGTFKSGVSLRYPDGDSQKLTETRSWGWRPELRYKQGLWTGPRDALCSQQGQTDSNLNPLTIGNLLRNHNLNVTSEETG